MAAQYQYEPYLHVQSVPAAVWTVPHGFGRPVAASIFSENDVQILADSEIVDDNTLTVSFFVNGVPFATTGRVVVS